MRPVSNPALALVLKYYMLRIICCSGIDLAGLVSGIGGGEVAAEASNFVVAYAFHKMLAPVRIGITLAAAPVIVRYLRKIGVLKMPKPPTK